MKPVIGITCSRTTGGAWGTYSLGHFMDYTYSDYSEALLDAGAAPVIVPTAQDQQSLETILGTLQGLILSGGPDLHPRHYGQEPMPGLGEVDAELDRMELAAARTAIAMDLPLLGICRGIQVLTVALGGTLYQDLPSQVPESICHTPKADKAVTGHRVRLVSGSRLHRLCRSDEIWVNSQHHQAINDPAPGLTINAQALDGIIEAVDYPANRFALGVQWHPEGTWRSDPHSRQLFAALVTAAQE